MNLQEKYQGKQGGKNTSQNSIVCQETSSLHFVKLDHPHHTPDAPACRVLYLQRWPDQIILYVIYLNICENNLENSIIPTGRNEPTKYDLLSKSARP